MRISDWSSDVCSSDLFAQIRQPRIGAGPNEHPLDRRAGDPDAALQPHIGKSLFHRGPPRGVAFMARIGNGLVDGHELLRIGAPAYRGPDIADVDLQIDVEASIRVRRGAADLNSSGVVAGKWWAGRGSPGGR